MASQAIGILTVKLSKEKVQQFEEFFDEKSVNSFANTEIELVETKNHSDDIEERLYDFSCSYSLYSCLVECYDRNIRDVCDLVGVKELEIEAKNGTENFSECIKFRKGKCVYTDSELCSEEVTKLELTPLTEMEAE